MAITLRSAKGAPLTHDELDINFTEFFYSASIDGSSVIFHRYTAISSSLSFPIDPPSGRDGYIQLKSGNALSGSNAVHTSSANFKFDYTNDIFSVTGSTYLNGTTRAIGNLGVTGSLHTTGNGYIGNNLIVNGSVTAEEFISEKIHTTYIYRSGSTKFGDSSDDVHSFTGSVNIYGLGNVSQSIAANTTGITDLSSSVAATYLTNTTDTLTGDLTVTGRINATEIHTTYVTSSVLYNTGSNTFGDEQTDKHIFTGSVDISNNLSIPDFSDVSASLAALITAGSPAIVNNSGTPQFVSGITKAEILTLINVEDGADVTDATNVTAGLVAATSISSGNKTTIQSNIGVDAAGTDNSTNVTLETTSHDYLSIDGQEITLGTVDISDDTNFAISDTTGQTGINLTLTDDTLSGVVSGLTTTSNVQFNKLTLNHGAANGLTFPADPGGGSSDTAKIVYYASSGENTVLELAVANDADDNIYLNASGGTDVENDLRVTGDVTAFYSSDERLKDNITPISNPIEKIKQIGGYEFDWNENSKQEGHDVGVIAQEIENILPELVTTRDNGYKAVRYEKIVALLIEAVKEQQSQIEDLKSRL